MIFIVFKGVFFKTTFSLSTIAGTDDDNLMTTVFGIESIRKQWLKVHETQPINVNRDAKEPLRVTFSLLQEKDGHPGCSKCSFSWRARL